MMPHSAVGQKPPERENPIALAIRCDSGILPGRRGEEPLVQFPG
ncbi:hypothetical protein [Rubripirellula lacrimiformis]|nr:hypothetical protein [Rubripirellula lacrimiformis]